MDESQIKDSILQQFLKEKKDYIIKKYKPVKFILFGSRVWGKPDEFSDIDLILVSNEFNKERFVGRMGNMLKDLKFHEHIDALCYTQEEFERKLKESYIVRDAVKKGYNVISF
jgi:predicted nucleotidyltransferase